jgi:hypothetical protein
MPVHNVKYECNMEIEAKLFEFIGTDPTGVKIVLDTEVVEDVRKNLY